MTQAKYEVTYVAPFESSGDAMNRALSALYLADIDATEVHVDLSAEEKRMRKQRLDTVYVDPTAEPARAA